MKALGASAWRKFSPLGGGLKIVAVLAVAIGFGLAAERTDAAHAGHGVTAKPAKEPVTSVAVKDVEATSSIETKSANDAPCDISRKRLFVEGEGWIVRRVPTCY
jgi:hypothetical protein